MSYLSKTAKRIKEENLRVKEWEEKFDREQKLKEDELIKKFYSDSSPNIKNQETAIEPTSDAKEENKNN